MAAITHYIKQDFTQHNIVSDVDAEETNYTIPWATLTGAGFANGDQVAVIVKVSQRTGATNTAPRFQVKVGENFAGATVLPGAFRAEENPLASGTAGLNYLFIDDYSLVTNDNIYFSAWSESGGSSTHDDFSCIILKVADLTATNYKYAETTPSGNASTSETDGASVTLGAGDWIVFGMTQWLDDDVTADCIMTLDVNGSEVQRVIKEGEDTTNTINLSCLAYCPGLTGTPTAKVTYLTDEEATQDCVYTKVMAIRLDAFRNHWGVHSTNTITHSVLDTYSEVCGNGSYTPSVTGYNLAICFPKHQYEQATHAAYGLIQVDGSDWPAAGANRWSCTVNGPTQAHIGPILFGYGSLTASTAYDFDFDAAEDTDISPTYDCIQQDAVIFSLELASSSAIKTINGLVKASVKTVDNLAIASVKTWEGLA